MKPRQLSSIALVLVVLAGCRGPGAHAAGPGPSANSPTEGAAGGQTAPFATPPVLAGTPDIATLVARVKPAVVNITTTHVVRAPRFDFEWPFGMDPFGEGGPFSRRRQNGQGAPGGPGLPGGPGGPADEGGMKQQALGSGFIVDAAGHVVTNAHVVEGADSVRVRLSDDREFDAKVKGRDPRLDLAVLELIGAKDLPYVSLGSSGTLRVGEYVVAIGNPFGLSATVTMGIVSAKDRTIGAGPYDDFIQTDASINPGNSGGPLFDLRGQVIGINTAINPNGKGIGFAIPVDSLKDVLPQLITTGHVSRGRLGVGIQPLTQSIAKAIGMDKSRGALIAEVEPAGPADKAGLRPGDVIVSVNGVPVNRAEELPRLVARNAPGTQCKLDVLRDRVSRSVDVNLDELRERDQPGRGGDEPNEGPPNPRMKTTASLGIDLLELPNGGGLVVERVHSGAPADGELVRGDMILEVNRAAIVHASDLTARLAAVPQGQPILLKIRRSGNVRFVAIERK